MEENFKIGNFICELRKAKGLSQSELGERLHVTNKAVSRWETGRGLPDSALLLPLSEILGVTVDEILRGELTTTAVTLKDQEHKPATVEQTNTALAYRAAKKLLIRDSLIVLPIVLIVAAWLILNIGFGIGFAPSSDYYRSMMLNLFLPLAIILLGQLVYAIVLICDTWRLDQKNIFLKLLAVIGVWYAVSYLFLLVYIRRIVIYIRRMRACRTV